MSIQTPYGFQYEAVAANQSAQVLGGTGATGDHLHNIVINVTTSGAGGTVTLLDGSTSTVIVPASTPVGCYWMSFDVLSTTGPWKVTTGTGASVIATGIFSA